MNTRFATALVLSLTLASTSVLARGPGWGDDDRGRSPAYGQRDHRGDDHHRRDRDRHTDRWDHRRYDDRRDRDDYRAAYGARHFHRGERLPAGYRDRVYVVNHWHEHHLRRPPHGHEWVQIGGDYVLVAIATGVIASIILNQ
ncbi:RcnB family protein [Nitrogeniibacter mangrovi]|uniref:RcnB family protein n=1 Tax=Nitrogeniibacter mangrovi TaxID=2016596 RepID=A0A6C1B4I4_9RHOO|nr:RcnB family protein [Nitrogeniibacter mangrovi]QID18601.1 RcnB family protein [Nitrogeniibacter mangrovi]